MTSKNKKAESGVAVKKTIVVLAVALGAVFFVLSRNRKF